MSSVLFVQSNAIYGACEEYLSLLMRGLAAHGLKVALLCPDAPRIRRLAAEVSGVAAVRSFPSETGGVRALVRLTRAIRRMAPSIVHVNDPGLLAMAAARLSRGMHAVLTYHAPLHRITYSRRAQLLSRWAMRGNWHVIALSEANQRALLESYPFDPSQVYVIPPGLDPARFAGAPAREAVLKELGLPAGAVLLGNVSRLDPPKNHRLLFEAVAQLSEGLRESVRILLVGDGELRVQLGDLVRDLKLERIVVFAGHREDVPRLLSAMNGLVLTSNSEGLPFAILEAMATGLPVVATAVGGIPDVVRGGETGILVPPRDVSQLVSALEWLLTHGAEAREMGARGKVRFLKYYTQDQMVAATRKVYEKISGLSWDRRDSPTT